MEPEDGVRRFQIVQNTIPELSAEDHIGILQLQLSATDYVVIKIAEGVADKEKYADILAQRQQWRDEINFLEAILEE